MHTNKICYVTQFAAVWMKQMQNSGLMHFGAIRISVNEPKLSKFSYRSLIQTTCLKCLLPLFYPILIKC